jgi:intracellular sulfur oxidation DsrE/DsrF family protein
MPAVVDSATGRRSFLARLSAAATAAAALVAGSAPAFAAAGARGASPLGDDTPEPWLRALTGKHKQLFHTRASRDGRALQETRAYLDIYPKAYGLGDRDVNAVVAAHGIMLCMLLGDEIWKRYELGAFPTADFTDPRTNAPALRNIYLTDGEGEVLPEGTSVPALMKRGVTFLACNNALTHFSQTLAARAKRPQPAVYDELRAGLVPGSVVVPAMIIAINRAQERGCSYIFTG